MMVPDCKIGAGLPLAVEDDKSSEFSTLVEKRTSPQHIVHEGKSPQQTVK